MKLILPMAGVGQRLRPFTFSKPKAALKIGGKMVLDHILKKISYKLPPHTPLAVIYGYKKAQIRQYFTKTYDIQYKVKYIDQEPKGYQNDIPYFGGLGEAIYISKSWFEETTDEVAPGHESDETLIFLCDMIPVGTETDPGYNFIIEKLQNPNIDGIIGTMVVPPEKTRFYGMVEFDDKGQILELVEKPEFTTSTLAIAGVYAFKKKAMERLYYILDERYKIHQREIGKTGKHKEFQFTPALDRLVKEGFHLEVATFEAGILDFGRPDALLQGNKVLLKAQHYSIEGSVAKIEHSTINNPCAVGDNCVIIRSVIGPYVSIGNNCVIENCNLQNVVVGDNCTLKNIITKDSIIGDGVKIDSLIKDAMILGDHTSIIESLN